MAHITGTSFELVQAVRFGTLANVETAVISDTRYVYATRNFAASEIQIYTVADDGTLSLQSSIPDTLTIALGGVWGTNTFTLGGKTYLAVAGQQDDGVSVFEMLDTAPYLQHVDSIYDGESTDFDLNEVRLIATHQVEGNTYLTVGGRSDIGGITVLRVADDGTLSFAAKYEGDIDASIYRGWPGDLFEIGGKHYFMITYPQGTNWSIMSIDPATGALELEVLRAGFSQTRFDSSGHGSLRVVDGVPYMFVPSLSDSALYVYTYEGGDDVIPVTSITLPTQLAGAAKSQIYLVGDKIIVGVGSTGTDAGVQLFDFDVATQTLTELQWLPAIDGDPNEQLLSDVTFGPTNYYVDSKPYAMIIGDNDGALNVYAIGGGDDVLTGTMDADLIEGFGGNDELTGLAGDDVIRGFDGNDSLFGNRGNDDMTGGDGDDYMEAGLGDDLVNGGDGNDVMLGFAGNDRMFGGTGDDTLKGGAGADLLKGEDGDDEIVGGDGHDTLAGQLGNDLMNGGGGNDMMDGHAGFDRMFGGGGDDIMDGGDGGDLLKGNDGDDEIVGGEGNDILAGQTGDDNLSGNAGNDVIQGGAGRDRINGGEGDDLLTGGSAADVFVFDTVAGTGGGFNRITDFTDGIDLIDLVAYGYADATAALSGALQVDADVNLTLSDGQIVWLDNFLLGDLDGSDLQLTPLV